MPSARSRVLAWTDCLLDPACSPGEQREAAHAWCAWALDRLGVDENRVSTDADAFCAHSLLAQGKAISPLAAARCVREHRRTAVFLQAMLAAVDAARAAFPGETIHVLEAGCGPVAPLVLPLALRFPPAEVVFTLLDLHAASLDAARHLAGELGVTESIRAFRTADAISARFADAERPHVIACEVLLRALTREPQVAATLNLAPQSRPGGIFLPQRIDVDAGLLDWREHQKVLMGEGGSCVVELGRVFSLDAGDLGSLERVSATRLAAGTVNIPPHDPMRTPLHLFTRIRVFREHVLGDFDSSLNLPQRVKYPASLAATGGPVAFYYEISADPGLRLHLEP